MSLLLGAGRKGRSSLAKFLRENETHENSKSFMGLWHQSKKKYDQIKDWSILKRLEKYPISKETSYVFVKLEVFFRKIWKSRGKLSQNCVRLVLTNWDILGSISLSYLANG